MYLYTSITYKIQMIVELCNLYNFLLPIKFQKSENY